MICLDTNVVVDFLRGRSPQFVERFKLEVARGDVALPVMALFELQFGIVRSARFEHNARQLASVLRMPIAILPFDPADAEEAADIRAHLSRTGKAIGPYDVLIAAQARRRDAILVTANTSEFTRVPRLRVENWL